jgi:ribonuclease HI
VTPQRSLSKEVIIYTDGACIGNPGRGGYGVVLLSSGNRRELSGGFRLTTNNRMELLAAIEGLGALTERSAVTLHSDSRYVVNAMELGWAHKWRANAWHRTKTSLASNHDLWMRLIELAEVHDVAFRWVPGHAGVLENERCDRLAVAAANSHDLPVDVGYESSPSNAINLRQTRLL